MRILPVTAPVPRAQTTRRSRSWRDALVAASIGALTLGAQARQCDPHWAPGFGPAADGVTLAPGGIQAGVKAALRFNDGSGDALYITGTITAAGGVQLPAPVAKWNGDHWSAVGDALPVAPRGNALCVHDDGAGPRLYAAVDDRVFRLDGATWTQIGDAGGAAGISSVLALVSHDDGSGAGQRLFAGGYFTNIDGVSAAGLAAWDGDQWSALHEPLAGHTFGADTSPRVCALTVFNDGVRSQLIAGGSFTSAGVAAATLIARWDGDHWFALVDPNPLMEFEPNGPNGGAVAAMCVHDDGSGPALFVGGDLRVEDHGEPGVLTCLSVGRWNGQHWATLRGGVQPLSTVDFTGVRALASFDDGSGPALYVGGDGVLRGATSSAAPADFTFATGILRWRDNRWDNADDAATIEGGIGAGSAGSNPRGQVFALAAIPSGPVRGLFAMGDFSAAGAEPSANIALLRGCAIACADINGDGFVDFLDLNAVLGFYGQSAPNGSPAAAADLDADGVVGFTDLNIVLSAYGTAC